MGRKLDLVKQAISTTGTGATLTLGAADAGYQTLSAAGGVDGKIYTYWLVDTISGSVQREKSYGAWSSSGGTIGRTLIKSTTGALLNLSGSAKLIFAPSADEVGDPEPIVILATGQSNFVQAPSLTWVPASNARKWNNTVGTDTSAGSALVELTATTVNVAEKFASEVARANPNRKVYLLNVSFSGQDISHWMTGASSPDAYTNIATTNIANFLTAVGADCGRSVTTIDAFLWWQGESDAINGTMGAYADNFETVLARFRALSWMPQATPILIFGTTNGVAGASAYYDEINDILKKCASVEPEIRKFFYTAVAPTSYWTGSPAIHMTATGYAFAGALAARAFLNATPQPKPAAEAKNANSYNDFFWNNNFEVSQINGNDFDTGAGSGVASGAWVIDGIRILAVTAGAGALRVKQLAAQSGGVEGVGNFVRHLAIMPQATENPLNATTSFFGFGTLIEGYRMARLRWGTSMAKGLSIGFFARPPAAGTYGIRIAKTDNSRSIFRTFQGTTSWAWYSFFFPGDTTAGTWVSDNTADVKIDWVLAAGSTYHGTAAQEGQWQASNLATQSSQVNLLTSTSSREFWITGIVILPGLELPDGRDVYRAMKSYPEQLADAKRYYQKWEGSFRAESTTVMYGNAPFAPEMRDNPNVTLDSGSVHDNMTSAAAVSLTLSAAAYAGVRGVRKLTVSSGLTSGNHYRMQGRASAQLA